MEPSFPKKERSDPVSAKIPGISTRISTGRPHPETFLDKFVERMSSLFGYFGKSKKGLKGRVEDVEHKLGDTIVELEEARDWFIKTYGDDPRYKDFENLLFLPLLKEGKKLKTLQHNQGASQRVKSVDLIQRWKEKVDIWLKPLKRDSFENLVIKLNQYLISDVLLLIDRDLQIIHEYKKQGMSRASLSGSKLVELETSINASIAIHLASLISLKEPPARLTIEKVREWKELVSEKRQVLFEETLEVIDAHLYDSFKEPVSKEEHDHLLDAIKQIGSLEKLMPQIRNEVNNQSCPEESKQKLLEKISSLRHQAHKLSLDLRLSQDLFHRLQKLINNLNEEEDKLVKELK